MVILDDDLVSFPITFQDIFGEGVVSVISSQLVSMSSSAMLTRWLPTVGLTGALLLQW